MPATPIAATVVDIDDVDVRIAGANVLEGICWRLDAGTRWGVIGPNGSGKSSLLRLVAGMLWPAPGRGRRIYDFGGGPLTDAVEARQRISLIGHELQNRYARWGWNFRALDVVRSGVSRTDIPRRKARAADIARARELLATFRLTHLEDRRFLELSRGEQRRVLIARSLAFDPVVLLLDEPASGLDSGARAGLDETIAAIGPATTVVCSGHVVDDLPAGVGRLIELDGGRIRRQGRRPGGRSAGERNDSPRIAAARPTLRPVSAFEGPPHRGPLIEVERADVWLGNRRVLENLSWTLAPDEHWLVTGPNGAGKSTFLRLLHGQLRPARGGTIRWPALGNPRNVWTLRKQLGFVSAELQAAYRYPTTAADCIASGFESSHGLTRALSPDEQTRVAALIDRFGLGALADRRIDTLSYGQAHRVLLARTLVNSPRALLLDEPFEGLDAQTRALLHDALTELMERGTQIVCISHLGDLNLPFTHSLVLDGGRISSAGEFAVPRESSTSAPSRGSGSPGR